LLASLSLIEYSYPSFVFVGTIIESLYSVVLKMTLPDNTNCFPMYLAKLSLAELIMDPTSLLASDATVGSNSTAYKQID